MRPPYKRALLIALVSLAVVAILIAGAWYAWKSKGTAVSPPAKSPAGPPANSAAGAPAGPEQSLTYWLTVQKMLNKKPLGKPIDSAGNIIFGNGWKFRFNVRPVQSGALYLLGVGPGKKGGQEYNILFPLAQQNQLDARLQANQTMQSDWLYFVEHTGEEQLWIIWSARPIPELDKIFTQAAGDKQSPGVVADASQIAKIEAYLKLYDPARLEKVDQSGNNLTSIKGWGEVVISLVQLKHAEV